MAKTNRAKIKDTDREIMGADPDLENRILQGISGPPCIPKYGDAKDFNDMNENGCAYGRTMDRWILEKIMEQASTVKLILKSNRAINEKLNKHSEDFIDLKRHDLNLNLLLQKEFKEQAELRQSVAASFAAAVTLNDKQSGELDKLIKKYDAVLFRQLFSLAAIMIAIIGATIGLLALVGAFK
jgi:hypothetical protein